MFGPPGHAYVFLAYGLHWHFNLVAAAEGLPHAVLIRAVEPLVGVELMADRRQLEPSHRNLTNGPGKLCAAFAIDRQAYGTDLTREPLFLSDPEPGSPRPRVVRAPRVGIDYAGAWAARPWRFYDRDSPFVSRK